MDGYPLCLSTWIGWLVRGHHRAMTTTHNPTPDRIPGPGLRFHRQRTRAPDLRSGLRDQCHPIRLRPGTILEPWAAEAEAVEDRAERSWMGTFTRVIGTVFSPIDCPVRDNNGTYSIG